MIRTIEEILDRIVSSVPPTANAGWERKQDAEDLEIYELRIPKRAPTIRLRGMPYDLGQPPTVHEVCVICGGEDNDPNGHCPWSITPARSEEFMAIHPKLAEKVRVAVAQGWCALPNAGKAMDSDLASAIVGNVTDVLLKWERPQNTIPESPDLLEALRACESHIRTLVSAHPEETPISNPVLASAAAAIAATETDNGGMEE